MMLQGKSVTQNGLLLTIHIFFLHTSVKKIDAGGTQNV